MQIKVYQQTTRIYLGEIEAEKLPNEGETLEVGDKTYTVTAISTTARGGAQYAEAIVR